MLMRLRRFRTSRSRPRRKRPPHPLLPRLRADVRGCCPPRAEIVTSTIMQRPCLTASRPSGVGKRVRTPPQFACIVADQSQAESGGVVSRCPCNGASFAGHAPGGRGHQFRSDLAPCVPPSRSPMNCAATSSSCDSAQPQWSDQRAGARPGLRAKWRHPLLLVSARRHPPVRHTDENKMISRASYARSGSNANHAVATMSSQLRDHRASWTADVRWHARSP